MGDELGCLLVSDSSAPWLLPSAYNREDFIYGRMKGFSQFTGGKGHLQWKAGFFQRYCVDKLFGLCIHITIWGKP
jgi:hypothetical protein